VLITLSAAGKAMRNPLPDVLTPRAGKVVADSEPLPKIVAVIPARGGSVSIPKKNIKELLGRPLIDWVIKAARDSGIFESIWVSTDDDLIAATAERCGALVHRRAAHTATSTASTESALKDFADAHPEYDYLCLIQATSPLLRPEDFVEAMRLMRHVGADSLVTAVRAHRFMWSVDEKTQVATAKNYEPLKRPRRQDWGGELIENGAFYYFTKAHWEATGCRLGGKQVLYEMDEHTLTELDSLVDWQIVSHMAADFGYFPSDAPRSDAPFASAASVSPFAVGLATGLAVAAGVALLTRK